MKKIILSSAMMLFIQFITAQTWIGSGVETGNTYRSGSVGIGNVSPITKFHLTDGVATITGTNSYGGPQLVLGPAYTHNNSWGIETMSTGLNFWRPASGQSNPGNYKLFIANNGNVSIGTENSFGYKFAVKGSMIAEQVVVKLYGTWPDFVFKKNYGLMNLDDLENYITKNNHLPNVPSATEVKEKGIDVGEMNKILLQKIEELTLYVIDQQKQIDELKKAK
jgi:hypothetical protein